MSENAFRPGPPNLRLHPSLRPPREGLSPGDIYSRIGSSIEAPGFYPHMTAKENLTIFSRLTGKPDSSRIEQALDTVGLSSDSQKTFSQYSLGMKQRLALANALLKSPRLLILDEPANGLDPIGIADCAPC